MKVHHSPHHTAKAVVAFIIVVTAFSILYIFEMNKDNIMYTGSFQPFMFFAFLGSGLLLTLLFLVNKSEDHRSVARKSRSRKRR